MTTPRWKRTVSMGLGTLASLASLAGCPPRPAERVKIVVSVEPLFDLVRRIAGPDADVVLMVPVGVTPHGFTPPPDAIERVRGARAFVGVGLGLDPWMDALVPQGAAKARFIKVGDRVPTVVSTVSGSAGATPGPDPHVWLDPQRAQLIVRAVVEEIARADGSHAMAYRRRASELDTALQALDKQVEARAEAWKGKPWMTFHDAFAYFAERYHLNAPDVIELRPGEAPTPARLASLAQAIHDRGVKAVMREPQLDDGPAKALAAQAHVDLVTLDPLGGGAGAETYEKMILADVEALARAFP